MAVREEEQHLISSSPFLLENLYCEEERWEEEETAQDSKEEICTHDGISSGLGPSSFPPVVLLEQDLFWEEEELLSLITKEREQKLQTQLKLDSDSLLSVVRGKAVEWILKVNDHYGFSSLTAILAINYFDRFISSLHFQKDKPWMIQLVAVTCLSLAAKVEETQVPLLLDFQVEETKYVFEAKTIQRMELLVLSTLRWKMNPVTPLSFIDHIMRRLGLKNHLHWEFLGRTQRLLLSVAADSRYVHYLPSVLATATMMHVIDQVEPSNPIEYQNQLMGVLKIPEEEVKECYQQLIIKASSDSFRPNKRKCFTSPCSPSGVIDACLSGNRSNISWAFSYGSSSSSSSSSSPEEPPVKKRIRAHEQHMPFHLSLQCSWISSPVRID